MCLCYLVAPLRRSNNPYTESFVEPCVPRIRKGFWLCGFDWKENSEKRAETMEKSIPELKAEFM